MFSIDIMQDDSEIIHYDKPGIPLYVRTASLSGYPDMRALCHWHEDMEFIRIIKGNMNYDVNGKKIFLKENDCLMVNAKQMHYGYSEKRQECEFLCVLFHPSLFSGFRPLVRDYVLPITENEKIEYLHFPYRADASDEDTVSAFSVKIAGLLDRIPVLKDSDCAGYELEIIGIMHILWRLIYSVAREALLQDSAPSYSGYSEISLLKAMVSHIHQHYAEKITLEDIASSGNVCRSKCCMIFKRYLQQSPIDFLNAYRLEVSCHLLKSTGTSVTQIALSCGFNHLSYFSKLFLRHYGCTPVEYRRSYRLSLCAHTQCQIPVPPDIYPLQ